MSRKRKQFTGPKVQKVQQLSGLDDSIRKFYDDFMGAVEPDLTSKNIPLLEKKYSAESEDDRTWRAQRYNHAYNLFIAAFAFSVGQWQADLEFYKKQAVADASTRSQTEDQQHLTDVAQSLDNV